MDTIQCPFENRSQEELEQMRNIRCRCAGTHCKNLTFAFGYSTKAECKCGIQGCQGHPLLFGQ